MISARDEAPEIMQKNETARQRFSSGLLNDLRKRQPACEAQYLSGQQLFKRLTWTHDNDAIGANAAKI
jgi:hypothetical protein